MENSYRFFGKIKTVNISLVIRGLTDFNCLFCYCPMYQLPACPGNPSYMEKEWKKTIKVCTNCTFPHQPEKLRQGDCGIEASALIRKSDKELLHENFLRSRQTHDPSTVALCHYDCRGRILKQGRRSALYFPAVTYKCHAGAGKGTGNFHLCKKRTGRIPDAGRIGISSLCKRGVWAV